MDLSDILVSKEERETRMKICRGCPHYDKGFLGFLGVKRFAQCGVCHCFLRVKTKLVGVECPVGRW